MPNDFSRRHTVSPLNSQTTSKGVTNSVSNFGGILFTPIWNTALFWYAAGTLKVRVSLCNQNGHPPPLQPLQKPWFICQHIATAQLFQWVILFQTQLAFFIACPAVHCGLKYQHWPMNWTLVVAQKGCQWHTVPIQFRQN